MNQRSGYARLLRLRHTNLNGYLNLVLFEGSFGFAALLAIAGLMDPWGAVAVPAAVAIMVKYHDVIAGVLAGPAAAAQLRPPRQQVAAGRSPVPVPSRPTIWIEPDDAVPYPPPAAHDRPGPVARGVVPGLARGLLQGVARGVASVPSELDERRPPAPGRRDATGTVRGTGALRYNTAAMRMRENQGRFD